ncbi:hypothetical protein MTO96_042147 [Rhipicephalus appendiculatus]
MEKQKVNFPGEERAVLLDLLSRRGSVVENKRTDAASASQRRDSWKKIEDEFQQPPQRHAALMDPAERNARKT